MDVKKPIPVVVTGAVIALAATVFNFTGSPKSPYGHLPESKSLRSSTHFILVDDFNTGKFTERKGATWRTKGAAGGALEVSVDKVDGRSEARGHSLKADFHLLKGEKASYESFLNKMDVSNAEALVFRLKYELKEAKRFEGTIAAELTDWKHRKFTQDFTKMLPKRSGQWGDIVLPMELFEGIDADQIFSIRFMLNAGESSKVKGNLWIDEIAFYGKGDVAFESHRDNLISFPEKEALESRRKQLLRQKKDKTLLKEIAKDTWKYFLEAKDKETHLVVDHIRVHKHGLAADYTSLTNIAMDLMGTVSAMDLGFIDKKQARERVNGVLKTLSKMSRYKGFFYNYYNTKNLQVSRNYISSVDSGWLAIGLVVTRQAFDGEIANKATMLLDAFSFGEFIDPENNQMVIGFEVPVKEFGKYHYGMFASEARATSFYAIGKGDVPREHWWFLYRTPPKVWEWQNQPPKGKRVDADGMDYFQGYYEKDGKKFVPSWGGSLFEYLMPTLVMKERELAPEGLGANNRAVTELHRDYALKEKGYPVWGISPASTINGRGWQYLELGIKSLAVKGYADRKIVTPHVGFLALDSLPEDAIKNIRAYLEFEGIYGEYGLYDTYDLKRKKVNPQYLALDQGMILVALCNYLKDGSIQDRFHEDPVGQAAQSLLTKEKFFKA